MLKARYQKNTLQFKFNAGTSRGVLREKDTWFLSIWDDKEPMMIGIGECSPLKGLSIDDRPDFEEKLKLVCQEIETFSITRVVPEFPSLQLGLETALLDLHHTGKRVIFRNDFYEKEAPIPINGLIWMGSKEFMLQQIKEKLQEGYTCLKLKIGAIDFETEKNLLAFIRKQYSSQEISLRLDANGAFLPSEALEKLKQLAQFQVHSIEQPIKAGQRDQMANLCLQSPIPIALDEELIGLSSKTEKANLLDTVRPAYIILKPSLVGGFAASDEWITLAEDRGIGWWITSALESNIGLNAVCQYTFEKGKAISSFPQGLGTGSLYHNNIPSPLLVRKGEIVYQSQEKWGKLPQA